MPDVDPLPEPVPERVSPVPPISESLLSLARAIRSELGRQGGKRRMASLTPEERRSLASKAGRASQHKARSAREQDPPATP